MPNASFKTRRTDKILVYCEAGPKAEPRLSLTGTLTSSTFSCKYPPLLPQMIKVLLRASQFVVEDNAMTKGHFLFSGEPSPSSCYCPKSPFHLVVRPSSTVFFEVSFETKMLGAQRRAVEKKLSYQRKKESL